MSVYGSLTTKIYGLCVVFSICARRTTGKTSVFRFHEKWADSPWQAAAPPFTVNPIILLYILTIFGASKPCSVCRVLFLAFVTCPCFILSFCSASFFFFITRIIRSPDIPKFISEKHFFKAEVVRYPENHLSSSSLCWGSLAVVDPFVNSQRTLMLFNCVAT